MTFYVSAARLLDGTGQAPLENAVVEIEDGRIKAIHQGPLPEGIDDSQIHHFPDGTILPGLIDVHVHLNLPGDGKTLEEAMVEGPEVMLGTSMGNAAKALGAGITTLRDVGAFGTTSFSARRALKLGHARGAEIIAGGQPITITGGHTWYMGGEADGVEGLRKKVRLMIKQGADFIKVMGSGGGTLGTASWRPAFTLEEMQAIVDEAHRNDRLVAVHCLCSEAIGMCIDTGVDQIEHANFISDNHGGQTYDPKVVERLVKSEIPVTSTLAVTGTLINAYRALQNPTPAQKAFRDRWENSLATNMSNFRKMQAAGVKFVAGTDAGWRFTTADALAVELEMMHQGGYSASEAIHAATGRAADVIRIGDRSGYLKAGRQADLLVVKGNPLEDLDTLRDIELVLQAGKSYPATPRHEFSTTAQTYPS